MVCDVACRPIASGLQYAAFNNASGSFVLPQASFTGDDCQIAGSCKPQLPKNALDSASFVRNSGLRLTS